MALLKQDLRSEVLKLIETHRHLRVDTELLLETTPRKAQYSPRLVDLMQKEEESLRSAKLLSSSLDTIFNKIDELIKVETGSIFDKIVDQNVRKWTSIKNTIQNDNVNLSTKLNSLKKQLQQQRQQHKLISKSNSDVSDVSGTSPLSITEIDNDSVSNSTITTIDTHTNTYNDTKNITNNITTTTMKGKSEIVKFDILAEQLRLESYYNENWIEIEGGHLNHAFKMQEAKINMEWEQQEHILLAELETKRLSIQEKFNLQSKSSRNTGNDRNAFFSSPYNSDSSSSNNSPMESPSSSSSPSSPSRSPTSPKWHDKEKQKSLIHTAPVLAPVRDSSSRGGRRELSSRNRGSRTNDITRNAGIAELMKLEREHALHIENMKRQKLAAKRWMMRQSIRLNAQANSMINERKLMANLIKSDLALLNQLKIIEKLHNRDKSSGDNNISRNKGSK